MADFESRPLGFYGPREIYDSDGYGSVILIGYHYTGIIILVSDKAYEYSDQFGYLHKDGYHIYYLKGFDIVHEWIQHILNTQWIKKYQTIDQFADGHYKEILQRHANNRLNYETYNNKINRYRVMDLLKDIKNSDHKILFYTGAGISYKNIENYQDMLTRVKNLHTTEDLLQNPQSAQKIIAEWFQSIRDIEPNEAHHALTKLIGKFDGRAILVTANFDKLHHKTGIIPIHFTDNKNIDQLKDIHATIAIGLSQDRNGVIKRVGSKWNIVMGKDEIPDFVVNNGYYFMDDDLYDALPYFADNI